MYDHQCIINRTKKPLRGGRRPTRPQQRQGTRQQQRQVHPQNQQAVAGGGGKRRGKPTSGIWKTLEEAKRKQDSIRKRVRKYGRDDDSEYRDTPSCDEGGDSDSGEYDEEFDLQMLQESIEALYQHQYQQQDQQQHITGPPEQHSALPQTTNPPKKKKSGLKNSILKYNSVGIGKEDEKREPARLKSNMKGRFRRGPSKTPREDDAAPALTPEEAIVLVMKRHAYISDSDSEEFLKRKGSYSTIETAALSTSLTDDEHRENSLSPTGKRVVIRRRKRKEDTNPITSKQQHRAIDINSPPRISRTNQEDRQQQQLEPPSPQPLVPIKNTQKQQHVDNTNNYVILTQALLSPSLRSLRRREQRSREEEDRQQRQQQQQQDYEYCVSNRDYDSEQGESSKKNPDGPKDHSAKIVNKKSQQKVPANDSTNSDEYDDDFLGIDDSIAKKQTPNPSGTPVESQKNNAASEGLDSNLQEPENDGGNDTDFIIVSIKSDDGEDDSTPSSFTTAKTSKSAISKYSKASRKALEQDDWENDQKDDISFFDAIQDGGESNSDKSVKLSGAPPNVITDHQNKNERDEERDEGPGEGDGNDGEGGWAGRITSFVGYTIGALTSWEESGEADDAQDTSTKKTTGESESPSNHSRRGPFHELEIVRRCQEERMRYQAEENERREIEAAYSNTHKNFELLRQEEEARAPIWKEVIEYRNTMEGMGMSEMLAPLDSRVAAQDYDDRLAMGKTFEEQERKMRLNERNMRKMDMLDQDIEADEPGGCTCDCIVS